MQHRYLNVQGSKASHTTNFYIEDVDTGAGIRVDDGAVGWDGVQQDGGATITSIKRTSATRRGRGHEHAKH